MDDLPILEIQWMILPFRSISHETSVCAGWKRPPHHPQGPMPWKTGHPPPVFGDRPPEITTATSDRVPHENSLPIEEETDIYIYRYKHTHIYIYIYVYIFRVFLGFSPFIQLLLRWNSKHQLVPAPRSLDRSPWRSRTHLAWRSRWIDGNPPKTTQDTQLWGY